MKVGEAKDVTRYLKEACKWSQSLEFLVFIYLGLFDHYLGFAVCHGGESRRQELEDMVHITSVVQIRELRVSAGSWSARLPHSYTI